MKMKYWLKILGHQGLKQPLTEWKQDYVDLVTKRKGTKPSIKKGDKMVLYAVGEPNNIFALAEVTSEIRKSKNPEDDGRWPYSVSIRYEIEGGQPVNVVVADGVHLSRANTTGGRDLAKSVRQNSYVKLNVQEYQQATVALIDRIRERVSRA